MNGWELMRVFGPSQKLAANDFFECVASIDLGKRSNRNEAVEKVTRDDIRMRAMTARRHSYIDTNTNPAYGSVRTRDGRSQFEVWDGAKITSAFSVPSP